MTRTVPLLLLVFTLTSFSVTMEVKKDKVKFKKGIVTINGEEWALYDRKEYIGGNDFFKTLDGNDFVSISYQSYLNGKYDQNGKALSDHYQVLNFYNEEIGKFEVSSYRKQLVRRMNEIGILSGNSISIENIKKFKEKYSENVSERRFLTK